MTATAHALDVLGEATLGELEGTLRGRLVRPSDPDYDEARIGVERRPRPASSTDHPLRRHRRRHPGGGIRPQRGLALAVRGGAHSIAGFSTSDGGVVLDLSPMKGIRVDPITRRATAQAGLTWQSSTTRRRRSGWPSPAGWCRPPASRGSPSAAGSGGCCASTASPATTCSRPTSSPPTASSCTPASDEHPDLFWALRGGGGNFGVVTSMEFRCTRSAPPSSLARSSTRGRTPSRCSAVGATSPRPCPTSSPPWPTSDRAAGAVPARGGPRQAHSRSHRACTPVPSRTATRPPNRCAAWPSRWPT